jgi:hypothetical protein
MRPPGVGTWTLAPLPMAATRSAGLRARMRVVGTIDGVSFRSSLLPRGGGKLFVVVPGPLRDRIEKAAGDEVVLELRPDARPVVLRVPPDLDRALGSTRSRFDALAPSHRKAFLAWVAGAKKPETRQRRVAKTAEMVRAGRTLS